ncbi:hypothetical protein SERLA73DRAFT_184621 [Serpula lacrymans var. lacrymans S7.3]|uniref:Cytochrome P450 n=2 Tax=Serpula lacrymans var. lacrymans TaxID=341189 RepID=F8Q4R2_SERL3|nr:uncharacterized protein SERLADRAFT_472409 [Serpula lacrymans var. lacrymans S7.9]EGN96539.1 hypothetical protein SERLA73DRAFT_184621 [Serpula lacrymans var. lacrymans S7.3]EGO22082.1 hypothetical protein SERLADRAFT_472409 [Serpula lacrymans var. lacrymans S7.9]
MGWWYINGRPYSGEVQHFFSDPPTMSVDLLHFDAINPTLCLVLTVAFIIVNRLAAGKARFLPPGPRPLPVVGNIFGIKVNEPWITYKEWAQIHGNIVYSRLFGQEIIILNSEEVAKDLLERRSRNYSDRPQYITTDLFGWSFHLGNRGYGNEFRQQRRQFHQAFHTKAALKYHPVQLRRVNQLLVHLLETPENYANHLQTLNTSVIMEVTYGYDPAPHHDHLVALVERATALFVKENTADKAIIFNALPFLQYIPPWFPGANFQRKALQCQKLTAEMIEAPFQYTKQSIAAGTAIPSSMLYDLFSRIPEDDPSYELAMKSSTATAFSSGSETSSSLLQIFVLAMLFNPDVQQKAQLEIDAVVGRNRLPDFSDRPSLPYVEAVFRETLRWRPVVPLGVPHATTNDDNFEGYFIPKGATIVTNIWAMAQNEDKYPEPSKYKPERFFTADGKLNDDTLGFVFGFGRRVCAGRHIGDATVWAAIASILAVFNVTKAKDEHGDDIEVIPQWTNGITVHPLPFPCCFEPRLGGMTSSQMM